MKQRTGLGLFMACIFFVSCAKENITQPTQKIGYNSNPVLPDSSAAATPKGITDQTILKGIIQPIDAKPVLTLYNKKYFHGLAVNHDGSFEADHLAEGMYNLLIQSLGGYKDTLIRDIPVKRNFTADLGIIQLVK